MMTTTRDDIVRTCGLQAGRLDRKRGNRLKTLKEFRVLIAEFVNSDPMAMDAWADSEWDFGQLATDAFELYRRQYAMRILSDVSLCKASFGVGSDTSHRKTIPDDCKTEFVH